MDSNMVFWFQGFEKGIAALEQIEREKLFRACGKNCVQQGTLAFYQELYQAADGDVHRFFTAVNEFPCTPSESPVAYKAPTVETLPRFRSLLRLFQITVP